MLYKHFSLHFSLCSILASGFPNIFVIVFKLFICVFRYIILYKPDQFPMFQTFLIKVSNWLWWMCVFNMKDCGSIVWTTSFKIYQMSYIFWFLFYFSFDFFMCHSTFWGWKNWSRFRIEFWWRWVYWDMGFTWKLVIQLSELYQFKSVSLCNLLWITFTTIHLASHLIGGLMY